MAEPQRDIVLVVDDSPETLSFLTEAIERSGATVLVAVARRPRPGAGRRDHPGRDPARRDDAGHGRVRDLPPPQGEAAHLAHVPVIFMTGLSETEHIVKGLEAGGVDYVTKPIAPDEILARIRVHLASARAAQSARAALDTTGRTLFAVDRDGRGPVVHAPGRAPARAASPSPARPSSLPPQGAAWLRGCLAGAGAPPP